MNTHTHNPARCRRGSGSQRAFTLVELIVALSVFMILVLLGGGALIRIIDAHAKTQSLQLVMNNLNYTVESMSRSIRFGHSYDCGEAGGSENCATGTEGESKLNHQFGWEENAQDIVYKLAAYDDATNEDPETYTRGAIWKQVDDGVWQKLTSAEVDINELTFYVFDVGDDGDHPRVTVIIKGKAGIKESVSSEFTLQTTVNQRENER